MKNVLILLLTVLLSNLSYSQNEETCSDLFDKDLRKIYSTYKSQNSKQIILKYLKSDKETRESMQKDFSLEASAIAVIKKIPVELGLGIDNSSANTKYLSMYKEIMENEYISDDILQSIYQTSLPDKAFDSYDNCISSKAYNKGGVTLRNTSTQDDLIVLELKFKSSPAGGKISIKDAIYSTGTIVGLRKFKKDIEIIDGQVIYEHIKIKEDEDITITVAFNEGGVGPASLSFSGKKKRKSSDEPLGTIVASILNYGEFLKLNGLEFESDINKAIWVPCDGRNIGDAEGTYGAYSGGKAPDLRGLFLRAVNDMGAYTASVPTPNPKHLNPEQKLAGQFQDYEVGEHKHGLITDNDSGAGGGPHFKSDNQGRKRTNYTDNHEGKESRPKNISVYYYIKIR